MKISPLERCILIGWVVAILYVFAAFRGQAHPGGLLGELLGSFFSSLSAAYLQ